MASFHVADVLTARLAGWVHHRAASPAQEMPTVAALHLACDHLARRVEEPSLRSHQLAEMTSELHQLLRQVERLAEASRSAPRQTQEVDRARETLQGALQDVFSVTPYSRAPYGLCPTAQEAREVLRRAIWQTHHTLILLSWSTLPEH